MEKKLFVPGRTELAGNHTDHQQGRILASAVDLGLYADFEKNGENAIHIHSEGYSDFTVRLNHTAVRTGEFGTPKSLVRGMIAAFRELGLDCGGFNAEIRTTLPAGSGLSSSAAYTVLIGKILSELFNDGKVDPVVIARAAQQSENKYFGKPCGLMDQTACAVGKVITIDFKEVGHPVVREVPFDLAAKGFALCISDTKGSHADLTDDYAAVRREMESVAEFFGKKVLRDVDEETFLKAIPEVRKVTGDRAVVRAIHFYNDSRRAGEIYEAIKADDFDRFLQLIIEGGHSSFEFNQNAYSIKNPQEQGVPLALAISQKVLNGRGAWRLQGGGFAGTIQAFVPLALLETYKNAIDAVFGAGSCHVLSVRNYGAVMVTPDM